MKIWQGRQVQLGLSIGSLQMVVVWDMDQVRQGGEAVILTKVHTDIDIQAFKVASFDETR